MRLTIDPEFKEALLNLSQKEKDKYFLRLLKKDNILFHRLQFELTGTETQDELRQQLENKIIARIDNSKARKVDSIRKMMRYISGDITYHVKITTDKFGEPYLNTIMILETLKKFNPKLDANTYQTEKLNKYIVGRLFKILTQVHKLHEDDQFEFEEMFSEVADLIEENKGLLHKAMYAKFDLNWLWDSVIPEDVALIAKDARQHKIL